MSKLIVGIDFGTSTTVVRACIEGEENIYAIKHKESSVIPTLIFNAEDGKRLYGKDAESYNNNGYHGTLLTGFKMGLAAANPAKKEQAKEYIKDYLGFIHTLFDEQKHHLPPYQEMRVWVSYPAKWTNDMAEFMINTVKQVGFGNQVDGMSEPEAASCFSLKKRLGELRRKGILLPGKKANVMMLDMGAGTSDISLFQVSVGPQGDIFLDNVQSYPSVSEANSCGGREIDGMLSDYICTELGLPQKHFQPSAAKQWKESFVSDCLKSNLTINTLPTNVEMALSILGKDDLMNNFVFNRAVFEAKTTSHWANLYRIIEEALLQYRHNPGTPHLGAEDIDLVFLTGGHSQWYCVENLLRGQGVNGHIGVDYQGQDGKVHKALNFSKIKQDPIRLVCEALPHETVALGMCLRNTSVKVSSLATNNVWGRLLLDDSAGEIVPIIQAGEQLPLSKNKVFSATTRKRVINEYFDIKFELFYGNTIDNSVKENSHIIFDGNAFFGDILLALIGIGFMKNDYKVTLEVLITLAENGVLDFTGEAILYTDEEEQTRLAFSKGESKSVELYGN